MGFTVGNRHLMKCLRGNKSYGAASLCKMFLDNGHIIEHQRNKTFK